MLYYGIKNNELTTLCSLVCLINYSANQGDFKTENDFEVWGTVFEKKSFRCYLALRVHVWAF
jgi:hypothetical protein